MGTPPPPQSVSLFPIQVIHLFPILFQETAKTRKKELAELLNEHAQIVQEVVTMVKSSSERSLSEKENSAEPIQGDATDETPDE